MKDIRSPNRLLIICGWLLSLCFSDTLGETVEDSLFKAVAQSNDSLVVKYLENGGSLNIVDANGWPLLMAVMWRDILKKRPDEIIGGRYCIADFAFGKVLKLSNPPPPELNLFKYLIEHGADLKIPYRDGITPLALAVLIGLDSATMNYLIEKGSDVHQADELGNTPLHYAVSTSGLEKRICTSIFQTASIYGCNECRANHDCYFLASYMRKARYYWQMDVVTMLVDHGANVNAKNKNGNTVYDLAQIEAWVHPGDYLNSLIKFLKEKGGEQTLSNEKLWVYQQDDKNRTELLNAAAKGNTKRVRQMIEIGSDINHKDDYGFTALLLAVIKGHKETAEVLLKHGAKPNEKDGHGRTALMFAARQGNMEMIKLLLANNADRNVALDAGITAREIAYAAKHEDVVALLEQQSPKR